MADRLVVDVDGLETLAGTLDAVRDQLDATRSVLGAARDEVGSAALWDALDHFESHWRDGRGQLDENAAGLAQLLRDAATAYRQADEQLAADIEQAVLGEG